MNAPTLFDEQPRARAHDPSAAHLAAQSVRPASRELCEAIRWFVSKQREPKTAFQIAQALSGRRWSAATVRTACCRAGLTVVDECGVSPRGRACARYTT